VKHIPVEGSDDEGEKEDKKLEDEVKLNISSKTQNCKNSIEEAESKTDLNQIKSKVSSMIQSTKRNIEENITEKEIKLFMELINKQKVFRIADNMEFKKFFTEFVKKSKSKKENSFSISKIQVEKLKVYNHINGSKHIGRKQLLTLNLIKYFKTLEEKGIEEKLIIPETFVIKGETEDKDICSCLEKIEPYPEKSMWIIKPGEFSNRGVGIEIAPKKSDIRNIVKEMLSSEKKNCVLV